MKKINKYITLIALSAIVLSSCVPSEPKVEKLFTEDYTQFMQPGDSLYHLEDFVKTFMTERGNFYKDEATYPTRALKIVNGDSLFVYSLDTLPTDGPGIFIKGRIATDDYGGNFYKSMVIQELVETPTNPKSQQALRISVDLGSLSGLYALGQEILIRCNGLCIGRYANQPQLCIPSYNNKVYAQHGEEKSGWVPGRIPGARFNEVCHKIGLPNPRLLKVSGLTLEEIIHFAELDESNWNYKDQKSVMIRGRNADGLLVVIRNVHCTKEYSGTSKPYLFKSNEYVPGNDSIGNPLRDPYAAVFAPTTENQNYPQGRMFASEDDDLTSLATRRVITISTSEYAKYALYKLPDEWYSGNVTGILGFYYDNPKYDANAFKWSITPRGIYTGDNFSVMDDIDLYSEYGLKWVPEEVWDSSTDE